MRSWEEPGEAADCEELARAVHDAIEEETRDLVFPGAMAQRVIHGSRARRPWGRAQAVLLAGTLVVTGTGIVGGAAIIPALLSRDTGGLQSGEPVTTAPRTGVSTSALPAPHRLVTVGYVPPGWHEVPLVDEVGGRKPGVRATGGATTADTFHGLREDRTWIVRYERLNRILMIGVTVVPDAFTAYHRAERRRGAQVRPYPVTPGRALEVLPRSGRHANEIRIYWEPRAGVLIGVRSVRMPRAELRRVVSGLRVTA